MHPQLTEADRRCLVMISAYMDGQPHDLLQVATGLVTCAGLMAQRATEAERLLFLKSMVRTATKLADRGGGGAPRKI
jgi:hypothetical protein